MNTTVLREINALRQMTVGELSEEWQRLYGEPTRSRNKEYLFRRLAWRVQELAHGGLTDQPTCQASTIAAVVQQCAATWCILMPPLRSLLRVGEVLAMLQWPH